MLMNNLQSVRCRSDLDSGRLRQLRAGGRCRACPQDIAAILDPAQFTIGASTVVLSRGQPSAVSAGETTALTMVASPRALGMIRADYSDVMRKALRGEVGKDLVKLPVYEIEKQLLLAGAAK